MNKWIPLVVVVLAVLIMTLDTTVMNVAIPTLVEDLDTDVQTIKSVIAVYALVMASFMILGGKLGDIYGRKKIFRIGVIIYGVGTFTAGISASVGMLLVGWSIVEGFASSLMMPATMAIIVSTYKGKDRILAFSVWGGVAAIGVAIGPIFGGFVTTFYTWRIAFLSELAIVFAILILSKSLIDSKSELKIKIDWLGVGLFAIALSLVIIGILNSVHNGFLDPVVLSTISGGLGLLVVFGLMERKREMQGKSTLISLGIFHSRQFTSGIATTCILSMSMAGFIFTVPLFLQQLFDHTAFQAGVILLPFSFSVLGASLLSAKLVKKIPSKWIVTMGLVISTMGIILLLSVISIELTDTQLLIPFIVFGLGIGFSLGQITNLIMSAIDKTRFGLGSGINTTMNQFGTSLGTALVGVILISSFMTGFSNEVTQSTDLTEKEKESMQKYGMEDITKVIQGTHKAPDNISKEKIDLAHKILKNSAIDSMQGSVKLLLVFLVAGIVTSMFIPNKISHFE